jgi:hypothetical protein
MRKVNWLRPRSGRRANFISGSCVRRPAPAGGEEGTDSQQAQQEGSREEGTQATGLVTSADPQTHEITIGDKTFVMPEEGGGASLFPQVGAEVPYSTRSGKNVITRIGQAQQ